MTALLLRRRTNGKKKLKKEGYPERSKEKKRRRGGSVCENKGRRKKRVYAKKKGGVSPEYCQRGGGQCQHGKRTSKELHNACWGEMLGEDKIRLLPEDRRLLTLTGLGPLKALCQRMGRAGAGGNVAVEKMGEKVGSCSATTRFEPNQNNVDASVKSGMNFLAMCGRFALWGPRKEKVNRGNLQERKIRPAL